MFRYHPDPVGTESAAPTDARCDLCSEPAGLRYVGWRRVIRKYEASSQSAASQTDAEQEAVPQQLREDHEANLEAHDADTLEASRDWYDNVGSPWRMEAGLALGILVLFGSLLVLILLFLLFKALAQ